MLASSVTTRTNIGGGGIRPRASTLPVLPGEVLRLLTTQGLYTDTGLTTPAVADDTVLGWKDYSTKAYHATKASAGPTLKAAIFGNKPGLLFDGSSNYLQANSLATLATGDDKPFTIIVVQKTVTMDAATRYLWSFGQTGESNSANMFYGRCDDVGTDSYRMGRRGDLLVLSELSNSSVATPDTNAHVVSFTFSGTTGTIRQDGVRVATGTCNAEALVIDNFTIGAISRATIANYYGGYIGAILCYNRALATDEVRGIERALGRLYNIPTATQGVWYVNTETGVNTNSGGLPSRPKLTLASAIAAAGGNLATIYIHAPSTAPLREQTLYSGTGNLTLRPTPGDTTYYHTGSVKVTTGWSSLGGGVYSYSIGSGGAASMALVCVTTLTDGDGNYLKLVQNSSTPTTPAAGQFGWDDASDTVYVRLPADANPNSHTIEVGKYATCVGAYGAGSLSIYNGTYRYASLSGVKCGNGVGDPTGGTVACYDTVAEYCANGFQTYNNAVQMDLTRCIGRYNGAMNGTEVIGDGFNVHGVAADTSIHPVATATDCEFSYNWDEGASAHDGCYMTLTDSHIHHNGASGVYSVNAARQIVNSCEINHNWTQVQDGRDTSAAIFSYAEGSALGWSDTNTGSASGNNVHDNYWRGIGVKSGLSITLTSNTSGTGAGNAQADDLSTAA